MSSLWSSQAKSGQSYSWMELKWNVVQGDRKMEIEWESKKTQKNWYAGEGPWHVMWLAPIYDWNKELSESRILRHWELPELTLGNHPQYLSLCDFPLMVPGPSSFLSLLQPEFPGLLSSWSSTFQNLERYQEHCGRKRKHLVLNADCAWVSPGKFCQPHCLFLIYLSSSSNRERTDILNSLASESKS